MHLQRLVSRGSADVFVKLEYFNPTGSYKDRMALSMIDGAERRGALRPGMRVVEYTGGSTGSSLAMVCAMKGYDFHPLSSDAFAVGCGPLVPISRSCRAMEGRSRLRCSIASRPESPNWQGIRTPFGPIDSTMPTHLDGYAGIGRELVEQIGSVDAFVGAVGTAGLLVGVSNALKQVGMATRIIALEPSTSPFLTAGIGGPHGVEGTAAGFWPPHLVEGSYDEARAIEENEGRAMARRAARQEGIFAGTSTGLNLVGALQLARELGPGKVVATVAVDTGLKYLAGDLYACAANSCRSDPGAPVVPALTHDKRRSVYSSGSMVVGIEKWQERLIHCAG